MYNGLKTNNVKCISTLKTVFMNAQYMRKSE